MRAVLLLRAKLLPVSRRILSTKIFNPLLTESIHFPTRLLHSATRILALKMTTDSCPSEFTHAITLPGQLDQPVTVIAAAGVSESDFRHAF